MKQFLVAAALLVGAGAATPTADARADSCWRHDGGGCGTIFIPLENNGQVGPGVAIVICNGDLIYIGPGMGACPQYV